MDVTPVLDIKGGLAVGAVSGIREKYLPLSSVICDSADPIEVSKAFREFGFKNIYVADLDGIVDRKPNFDIIEGIVDDAGLPLLLDVGVESQEDVLSYEGVTPVLGSETLSSLELLDDLKDKGVDFIVSIDLKDGFLLSELGLNLSDFLNLLDERIMDGGEVILLDLSSVGTLKGPNIGIIRKVKGSLRNRRIIYGGGVRDIADVKTLHKEGIRHVLVGSCLHTGKLSRQDLKLLQSL